VRYASDVSWPVLVMTETGLLCLLHTKLINPQRNFPQWEG